MQDYLKQANDFLEATNTEMAVSFLMNDFYFAGDKEPRDIYQVTIKRGARKISFRFGQSLAKSGFYYTMGKQKRPIGKDKLEWEASRLLTFIRMDSGGALLNNGKSDIIHRPEPPTAYDVLACLTKYDPGTFEDFCSDFGYDADSRTAKKTYKAVKKEWANVQTIWDDSEIEQLAEIQ